MVKRWLQNWLGITELNHILAKEIKVRQSLTTVPMPDELQPIITTSLTKGYFDKRHGV